MVLKADDGTPLNVREPIVLGQDGEEILTPPSEPARTRFEENFGFRSRAQVFRVNGWWVIFALLAIVPFLFLGAAFFTFVVVGALVLWAVRTFFRLLT
jgi:hypothetical protein